MSGDAGNAVLSVRELLDRVRQVEEENIRLRERIESLMESIHTRIHRDHGSWKTL